MTEINMFGLVLRVSGSQLVIQGLHRGPLSIKVMKMVKHSMVNPDFSLQVPTHWERRKFLR